MNIKIFIINENKTYDVSNIVCDNIILESERKGVPSKLTFKIARDIVKGGALDFRAGNEVQFLVDDIGMFKGYVFSKSRTKDHIITVTAYDQMRYLNKNKIRIKYEFKTASDVIKMLAADYKLQIGEIEDTKYVISRRIENDIAVADVIYNALDLTAINTDNSFVFYDDFGGLTLKNSQKAVLPLILISDSTTLLDFNYKTDIDTDTYNKVKLYRDVENKREVFIAQDSLNQMKWGVLELTQQISEHYSEAKIKQVADTLLLQKNRVKRTLSVEDIGDVRVRAGYSIHTKIKDVGESIDKMLIIEKCTHTFKNNEHTMKLELRV